MITLDSMLFLSGFLTIKYSNRPICSGLCGSWRLLILNNIEKNVSALEDLLHNLRLRNPFYPSARSDSRSLVLNSQVSSWNRLSLPQAPELLLVSIPDSCLLYSVGSALVLNVYISKRFWRFDICVLDFDHA